LTSIELATILGMLLSIASEHDGKGGAAKLALPVTFSQGGDVPMLCLDSHRNRAFEIRKNVMG
jgi:hypothetical protein